MSMRAPGTLPCNRQLTRWVTDLGVAAKREYFQLRDRYKAKGLTPREASVRAATELRVEERLLDLKQREACGRLIGSDVALTPDEARDVMPNYRPISVTKAEQVGSEEMSLAEQVAWAKRWAARVQNGEKSPTTFPSEGALFWFQSAVVNRRDFEKVVLRVESPGGGEDSLYLQEGQHQMKEIESQLKEALRECGEKLCAIEGGFVELLKEKVLERVEVE